MTQVVLEKDLPSYLNQEGFKVGRTTGFTNGKLVYHHIAQRAIKLPNNKLYLSTELIGVVPVPNESPFSRPGHPDALVYTKDGRFLDFVVGAEGAVCLCCMAERSSSEMNAQRYSSEMMRQAALAEVLALRDKLWCQVRGLPGVVTIGIRSKNNQAIFGVFLDEKKVHQDDLPDQYSDVLVDTRLGRGSFWRNCRKVHQEVPVFLELAILVEVIYQFDSEFGSSGASPIVMQNTAIVPRTELIAG